MTHRIAFQVSDEAYALLKDATPNLSPSRAVKDMVYYSLGLPIEVSAREANKVKRAQEMIERYEEQQREIQANRQASGVLLNNLSKPHNTPENDSDTLPHQELPIN